MSAKGRSTKQPDSSEVKTSVHKTIGTLSGALQPVPQKYQLAMPAMELS